MDNVWAFHLSWPQGPSLSEVFVSSVTIYHLTAQPKETRVRWSTPSPKNAEKEIWLHSHYWPSIRNRIYIKTKAMGYLPVSSPPYASYVPDNYLTNVKFNLSLIYSYFHPGKVSMILEWDYHFLFYFHKIEIINTQKENNFSSSRLTNCPHIKRTIQSLIHTHTCVELLTKWHKNMI